MNIGDFLFSMQQNRRKNSLNICNEIFGSINFVGSLIWQQRKGGGNDSRYVAVDHEYILIYAKAMSNLKDRWYIAQSEEYLKRYKEVDENGRYYWDTLVRNGLQNPIVITLDTPDGGSITINSQKSKETVLAGLKNGTVRFTKGANGWSLHHKVYMKGGQVLRSILTEYGNNRSSGDELTKLFGEMVFDYSKPSTLIKLLCQLNTKENDIIIDFFSGSATTAQAVMQLNAEDNGNRKFIMIQLPEQCAENSKAFQMGYNTICEVGKERIRKAGTAIKEDSPLTTQNLDTGFRVLKLDDTNMNDVYYSAGDYTQGMLSLLESNVKADRTDLDLLFGCLLEWGLPLSLPYTSETIGGCTVHTYNDGDLIACFDEDIPDSVIKTIAKKQPLRAVFRDSSFANSPSKINVGEVFKLLAPDTRVKVL